jgi:hypothetical protein
VTESGENCGESLNEVWGLAQRRGTNLEMRTDEINFDWIQIFQRLEGAGRNLSPRPYALPKALAGRRSTASAAVMFVRACFKFGKEIFHRWTAFETGSSVILSRPYTRAPQAWLQLTETLPAAR